MKRKADKILNFIKKSGKDGRRFSEIQRFIFNINHPDKEFDATYDRGYYCDSLCGGKSTKGILDWCFKTHKGKYVIDILPKGPIHTARF